METLKTTLDNLTPNQCTSINQTAYSTVLIDGLYYNQTITIKDGKVTACVQPTTYASAALAKTAINLLTAAYIDSL